MSSEVIKTICRNCNTECGIIVHVEDNDLIKVEGDPDNMVSRGYICPRASTDALRQLANDEKRLKYPIKRVNGKWERISWDEALANVATELKQIRKKYGARALAVYTGQAPGYRYFYWERFCNVFGTPNYITVAMLCFWSKMLGHYVTYGGRTYPLLARGITGLMPEYEENTKCMVVWGVNPEVSSPYGCQNMLRLKEERGAKLIVIDPRRIPLAEKADIWAQIRPGTDAALALGLTNVIIEEKLYDEDFVKEYTVGFEELAERALQYPPEKVEKITWVPSGVIKDIARVYATSRPGFIIDHVGVELHFNGFQAHRAIACLIGLTGNFDVPGGNILPPRFQTRDLSLSTEPLHGALDGEPIGVEEFPLMVKGRPHLTGCHMAHGMLLPKAIEDGTIKALILVGADLARMAPQTKVWLEAFKKLQLLVVVDLYKKKDYDDLAHIFLPAASFLERTDLVGGWDDPAIALREKCISRWEAWPDAKICFELAKKLGYERYFPWETIEDAINDELKPSGFQVEDLKGKSTVWCPTPLQYRKYEKNGCLTPSQKFEFYSLILKAYGYDPLPSYQEPPESPVSSPELAVRYPLILTTGGKNIYRTHSQFLTIPTLREYFSDPIVEINPRDAKVRSIKQEDWVEVTSPRGKMEARAKVTDKVHEGVVEVEHGWGGQSNVNLLTSMQHVDPISGYPGLRECLCDVGLCRTQRCYPKDEP